MVVYVHHPLANNYCYLHLVSYLPATTPWSSFAKRRNLPHNWMETGSSVFLQENKRDLSTLLLLLDLGCLQAVQAITLHFHLPFRLLSPRRCMFEIPAFLHSLQQTSNRASTQPVHWFQFARTISFRSAFCKNTYLGLSQAITSTMSTLGFWYFQRYFKIGTKKMVCLPLLTT
jgi:hypothetical protein